MIMSMMFSGLYSVSKMAKNALLIFVLTIASASCASSYGKSTVVEEIRSFSSSTVWLCSQWVNNILLHTR